MTQLLPLAAKTGKFLSNTPAYPDPLLPAPDLQQALQSLVKSKEFAVAGRCNHY
ncbi:MAG: hypothetical protein RRB22_08395 [Gammaproteobacteria bacterium]|nr:hypothetical protein [Gammaproteobacteria bacterium]